MANYMGDAMDMFSKVAKVAKQVALNLSEIEIKVDEATNNDPWGPHGGAMTEIADAAYDSEKYKDIMGVLARRLQSKNENWRHVYKSLLLLEHMLKNGPMKVVHELRNNIGVVDALTTFQYKDPKGKDQGINVRNRATTLVELCKNMDRIKEEREKAKENRNKYGGVSARDMQAGAGGFRSSTSGFGGSNESGSGSRYDDKFSSYDRYDTGSKYDSYGSGGGLGGGGGGGRGGFSSSGKAGSGFRGNDGYEPPKSASATNSPITMSKTSAAADDLPDPGTGKKKLSSTKVDPNIANTFAKISVSGGSPARAAPPAPAPAPANNNGNGGSWDAFSAPPAAAAAAAPSDGWDAFASAAPPAPAQPQADAWDAFTSAPAPAAAAPAPPQDPFGFQGSAPAAGGSTDLFASMTTTAPSSDPFAGMVAAPAPAAAPAAAAPAPAPEAKGSGSAPLPEDLFGAPQQPPATAVPNMMGGMGMPQQPQMMMQGGMGMMGGMGMPQQPQMMGGGGMGMMGGMGMTPQQQQQMMMGAGGMGMMGGMGMPQQQQQMMGMMGGMQQQPQMMMGNNMGMMGGGMGMGMPQQQQPQRQPPMPMAGSHGQVPKNHSNIVMSSTAAAKKDPFADLVGL